MMNYPCKLGCLLSITLLVLLSGCISSEELDHSFTIENAEMQKQLTQELKEKDILFKIDDRGSVWFEAKNQASVHAIAFKIMGK